MTKDLLNIRAILWDLDGTLQDSYQIILASFRHATRTVLGEEIPDGELMKKVGQPLATQMWDFTDDPAVHEELLRVYRAHNEAAHDAEIKAFPGMREAVAVLDAAGFVQGVVTSKRHELALRGLEINGLDSYMKVLVGSDDCEQHKPDPGPVLLGCELIGFAPEECLYVGDSPFDAHAGNGAGCTTVGALWGMFSREAVEAEQPDYLLEDVAELVELLQR